MSKIYGLSERDAQRLQQALRFVEDNATMFRTYRRIRGQQAGGGGTAFIDAVVVRGLLRADPERADPTHTEYGLPVAGFDDYVLRRADDTTAAWDSGAVYEEGDAALGHDGRRYTFNATGNTSHDPADDDGTWWTVDAEINPLHYARGAVDWRDFDPWFQVGEHVPLIRASGSDAETYQIAQQMVFVGSSHPSRLWIRGDGTNGYSAAVFA